MFTYIALHFSVFKIIGIEDSGFKEKANLRVGRINLNFSITDVQWHPHEGEKQLQYCMNIRIEIVINKMNIKIYK